MNTKEGKWLSVRAFNISVLYAICQVLAIIMLCSTALGQGEGCMKSGCHESMSSMKWVHGPVGAGVCSTCHREVESGKHEFEYTSEGAELCFSCHEDKREVMDSEHLHAPVEAGECTGCHDPHQSDQQYQLLGEGAVLCFSCHDDEEFNDAVQHGPVAVGACNACHDPHGSDNTFQLTSSRERICFQCHEEKEAEANSSHPHPPVQESCTVCHSPHSGPAEFMMSADQPQVCFKCHEDVESKMNSPVPHPPVHEGQCSKCHQVHGSDHPMLFSRPQERMCLKCHTAMDEYVENSANRHGPVKEGDCIACHDGHGSDQPMILSQYFPREFYNSFSTEKYAICFNCHNKDIALDSTTTTLTDFRDGDVNLHFKHVNKQYKGRSCKACHEVHASNQEKHIRKTVPFGKNWSYPITFTKTENGGSCVVGCHKPKTYDRSVR